MAQDREDPHAVLGVPAGAAWSVVRRAYRRQARRTHPDAGGNAADFRRVHRAWEALREAQDAPAGSAGPSGAADAWAPSPAASSGAGWGVAGEWPAVTVVPGRWWWLGRVAYVVVSLLVTGAGLLLMWPFDGVWPGPGWVWALAWAVMVVVVGVATVRGSISAGLVGLVVLLVIAIGDIGSWWWWGLAGFTAVSLVLPVVHLLQFRPMWSVRDALQTGPVFGSPDWAHTASAAVVEQLTVIPSVRVFHQVHGAAHVVVCGGQVAAVGAPEGWEFPGVPTARVWPLSALSEPSGTLDEIAAWLLFGGGTTVDRRVLADAAN